MTHDRPYGDRAAEHAAEVTRRADALMQRAAGWHPPLAPIGSGLVLALGVWTWVSIPVMDLPYSNSAWNTSLRDEAVAVLVTLAGVRLCLRPGSRVAALVALLCGVAMVAFAIWVSHSAERGMVTELVTGGALVVSAVIAMAPRAAPAP